jgi:hypothetical protein
MPPTKGFQLVPSDLEFLKDTHLLRLATIDHLASLSGRSYKQTQKRLAKLEEEKYLALLIRRPHKHVYGLGREGVRELIEQGLAPRELAEKRLRQNELKELGIKHAIFVSDIHVKLLQATRNRSLTIVNWIEGPAVWDSVTTSANVVVPVRPDAWFTIETPHGRSHFFLEADRGTMAHSRMREKVQAYSAYFQQQRHIKKYPGMKTFRVATVAETRGRARGLADEFKSMMPPAWLPAYPVVEFAELTIETLMPELAVVTKA